MTHTQYHEAGAPMPPAPVMTMLHSQVPLSLLCDLSDPDGPLSAEILAEEGAPESRWWEQ